MKSLFAFFAGFCLTCSAVAQVKIHAHNDYAKSRPLTDALLSKAYSIEADVFLVQGSLLVAHSLKETSRRKTLNNLYIDPIVQLFKKNNGFIDADSSYRCSLVIDIKQNGKESLDKLLEVLEPLRPYFDQSLNPNAVRVIISGDRGPVSSWKEYPSYLYFDGRPFEEYDEAALQKIAMISDNFYNYLDKRTNRGDSLKIRAVTAKAHQLNKPFRFWASPDNEAGWQFLRSNGADIINTDKPVACSIFFNNKN